METWRVDVGLWRQSRDRKRAQHLPLSRPFDSARRSPHADRVAVWTSRLASSPRFTPRKLQRDKMHKADVSALPGVCVLPAQASSSPTFRIRQSSFLPTKPSPSHFHARLFCVACRALLPMHVKAQHARLPYRLSVLALICFFPVDNWVLG